jgi:hypothetical protein
MEALTSHKSEELREARRKKDTHFDRIYKFYFSKKLLALTPEEEKMRERWDFGWKMLAGMFTRAQAALALIQKFNVSRAQAYDDVTKSMMLFGDPRHANKEAKRVLAEEWIVKGIKKAWDDGDLDAYERMLARYNKINRLEEDTDESMAGLIKKLKPTTIVIVSDAELLKSQASKLQEEITKDVEFEDAT